MQTLHACRQRTEVSTMEADLDVDHSDASDTQLEEKDDSAATALLSLGSGIPPHLELSTSLPRRIIVRPY